MDFQDRAKQYCLLMRLDKPIGILLLLWPTFWALWLASAGRPEIHIVAIFAVGVILMRSAGCVMNDFADRHFDGHIKRTANRPLAVQKVSVLEALILAALLSGCAFGLVLMCSPLTVYLAIFGALFTIIYPFLKRITHLPQLMLGVAFTWGIPMAFAAVTNKVSGPAWFLFFTAMLWPIMYDTEYAMVDREDDIKIGIKSSAILFATFDRCMIALLQLSFVILMGAVGWQFQLSFFYYIALSVVSLLFLYQQWLIKERSREGCFKAFLNNHWVGCIIFIGILL